MISLHTTGLAKILFHEAARLSIRKPLYEVSPHRDIQGLTPWLRDEEGLATIRFTKSLGSRTPMGLLILSR